MSVVATGLMGSIEFAPKEAYEFAETVYQLTKGGFLNAVSVGFMPRDTKELSKEEKASLGMPSYGVMYTKADLLEISVVSVPANPSALVTGAKSLVSRGVLQDREVDRFLKEIPMTEDDLAKRLKAKIRGFVDLGAETAQKSPACRQGGETEQECVSRKVPELIEEGMEQDQAVATAYSMCETSCAEKASSESKAATYKVGDMVSWKSSGGPANGKIERVVMEGELKVPNSSFTLQATEEDPAALIRVYDDGDPTDTMVGHRFSALSKMSGYGMDEDEEKPKKSFDPARMHYRHIQSVQETDEAYIVTYGKSAPEPAEAAEKHALLALVAAQTEQAKALTTLVDSISDLTKRIHSLGESRGEGQRRYAAPSKAEDSQTQERREAGPDVEKLTADFLRRLTTTLR